MRKLRVMMLVHETLVPPEDLDDPDDPRMKEYKTEYDVKEALLELGHDVKVIGIFDDISPIRATIEDWKPHIAFNLTEDFAGIGSFDFFIVSYLEMMKLPYTGSNARGMVLARDKAVSKKLLGYHRIKVPDFMVFPFGQHRKKIRKLPYPMVVKSLTEEGSFGIAQASFVENEQQLRERVERVHEITQGDVIAEQYIDGRELYVSVIGNNRLEVFPVRELIFKNVAQDQPRMATYKVKWDENYRERWGIDYIFVRNLPKEMAEKIDKLSRRIYRILELTGYARLDLRLTRDGTLYVLEANPNPGIADSEDVAFSAEKAGLSYPELIQRILNLGLRAHAENA